MVINRVSRLVLGELIGCIRETGTLKSNPDNLFNNAIWGYNISVYNASLPINYGLLIVFSAYNNAQGGHPVAQMCISNLKEVYVRSYWINSWSDWFKIS